MNNPVASQSVSDGQIAALVKRGWVDAETIDKLLSRQQASLELAQSKLAGTIYAIDPQKRSLIVRDVLSGTLLKEIPLGAEALEAPAYTASGSGVCLLEPGSGGRIGSLDWQPNPLYGLIVCGSQAYLYPPEPLTADTLACTRQSLYPGVHQGGQPNTAYDLYLGEDGLELFISDRAAGDLRILSTETHQITHKVQVRPQGYKTALNLTFDGVNEIIYMTDNQSFMIYALDLQTLEIEQIDVGMSGYALGNLALSPDGEHLYVLTRKPSVELMYLHIESRELIRQVPLKGELFSNAKGDPQDLMILTPDQAHLLLMTYLDDPEPLTPIITVIQADKAKTLQRFALKELAGEARPAALGFPFSTGLSVHRKSVLELLLSQGLITSQQLLSLEVVDLDDPEGPEEGQGLVPSLVPQAAPTISLEADYALPAIVSALSGKFYQLTEIELASVPVALSRIEAEAEVIRSFLEHHDSADVKLSELVESHGLETLLTRQEVLLLIERARHEASLHPPKICPACTAPLTSWDCESCGFELDSPERLERRKHSSLTPTSNLPKFHLLVADPTRGRLLQLDQNRTLDWSLEAESVSSNNPNHKLWSQPVSALVLPNKNLLVVDQWLGEVYECGPTGQIKWVLNQRVNMDAALNQPVKATYDVEKSLYLIVDQGNHRVFAVDAGHKIQWQFGLKGKAGGGPDQLNNPSDLQWTHQGTALIADTDNHRVIEIARSDNSLVKVFGPELGLNTPVFAQRLPDEHTLIVDAGNYRVLELDAEGDLISECFYFKEEMGPAMRMDRPIHAIRGHKKNLVLIDADKLIELLPGKNRLIWSSLIEHLARRVDIQEDVQQKGEQYNRSFYQYRLLSMEQIVERFKNRKIDGEDLGSKLMATFHRLLEVKRELDAERAERSKVKRYKRSPLLDIPLYLIDRTHRLIIQIDRLGKPVWYLGDESETRLQRPGHITVTDSTMLIADTIGQKVFEVDLETRQLTLSLGDKTSDLFNCPRSAWRTLSGNILVADQGNRRLVELNARGDKVWEFKHVARVVSPYYASEQGTGTILYVDWALQQVLEISRDGTVVWSYGQSRRVGSGPNQLSCPEYAVRLPEGSTLIADTRNNRVIEVAPNRSIIWQYSGLEVLPLENPSYCKRLTDGHTLIAYDNQRQLIEVDGDGQPCWHFRLGNASLIR